MFIVLFVAVLAVLILAHELGHFIVAKKNGIRVDEFGIGFPPRIFKFKKGETTYSINLLPIGGFVKIHGEDGKETSDQRSFASKSIGARAAVLVAGVFFNIILGWFLITVGYMVGTPISVSSVPAGTEIRDARIMILEVQGDTPAEKAGLRQGDQIVSFDLVEDVQNFIAENKGKEIELDIKRGDEFFSITVVPEINPEKGKGSLGIAMDKVGIMKLPWYKAIWEGIKTTYELIIAIFIAITSFIYGAIKGVVGIDQVMGPVGIVNTTGLFAKLGFSYLLNFVALLSINLAVLNILPFPALDGGRLLFLLIEKIKGSPISVRFSNMTHGIGLFILLVLMLIITYYDIMRLV